MSAISNLPEVVAVLNRLADCMNLSRTRRGGKRLGDEMADMIAAGVIERTLDQQRVPDGGNIEANRGRYGVTKRGIGIPVGVGLYGSAKEGWMEGGEMLSFEQVRGQVIVTADRLIMEYGLDDENKQKGEWFTDGNASTGQPPRPFYELNDDIEIKIDDIIDEAANNTVTDLGGA